jgi:thiazole synthase
MTEVAEVPDVADVPEVTGVSEAAAGTDDFVVAGETFSSRLLLGTGGVPSMEVLERALTASGSEIVTVALRRVDPPPAAGAARRRRGRGRPAAAEHRGCMTAREAVRTAQLGPRGVRHRLGEARGRRRRGHPAARPVRAARRAEQLVLDGFRVLAYTSDDPIVARRLADAGLRRGHAARARRSAAAWASATPTTSRSSASTCRCRSSWTPASARRPTRRSRWSWGATPCCSPRRHPRPRPGAMASAMRHAVEGGRLALRAGRIPRRWHAQASTSWSGLASL